MTDLSKLSAAELREQAKNIITSLNAFDEVARRLGEAEKRDQFNYAERLRLERANLPAEVSDGFVYDDAASRAIWLGESSEEDRELLYLCREKLQIYREQTGGAYAGGTEHAALIKRLDAAINPRIEGEGR